MPNPLATFVRSAIARVRRDRLDAELREEIRQHIELRRQQLTDDGMPPADAAREARRQFGNVTAIRERARDTWAIPSFDTLTQDLRYGTRVIAKSRGFSAIAVLSLAAGIGASTVLFSVANVFLFRPLHAANPAELVQVFTSGSSGRLFGGSSFPDYEDFRDRTTVFDGLLAAARARATLNAGGHPDVIEGLLVSDNYFDVLGLQPSSGRFFLPEENRTPGTHPVVIVSHDAWQRRLDSDPRVVGRELVLNGHAFTVVGIGPRGFAGTSFDHGADFFVPLMMERTVSPDDHALRNRRARVATILGRLRDGVNVRQANAAAQVMAAQLFLEYPDAWRTNTGQGRSITILPELDARFVGAAPGATVFIFSSVMGGVVVLLGIACVNVATLLMARAATRRKEIAIRLALGASRRRVVQQLLTECALLAAAGGLLALLIANWAAALFVRWRPEGVPALDLSIDARILLFGIASSALTVFLFGLIPALQTTRADVNAELKNTAHAVRIRRLRIGLRDLLVICQVAVSLVLIVGAALLLRSWQAGRNEDPGFRREGVLSIGIDLSTITASGDAHGRFYREAVRSVADLPGVQQVALAALVPLDGSNRTHGIEIREGARRIDSVVDVNIVGAGYFSLMDMPVVQGREFGATDRPGTPPVAVVNETMAQRFWNGDALGRVFRDDDKNVQVEIVGVVRDIRHRSFQESPLPMAYFSADQRSHPRMTMHIRSAAPSAAIAAAIERRLLEIHPAAGLTHARTMTDYMDQVTQPQRLGGAAAAAVGTIELALAIMALYGVIAYTTTQRTREIGLRMALGASYGSVARLIVRDGLVLAGIGIALGTLIALGAAPLLRDLLIRVDSTDLVSVGSGAALLLCAAIVASYVPARRALRVDPSIALRNE